MALIEYKSRSELIMLTYFGKIDKTCSFYSSLSDDGYFDSNYSVDYILNPPDGVRFDPADWKEIDHYALLGLKHVRWRATADKIKSAYRQRILAFHPDKGICSDDNYLTDITTCLNKSFDILSNPMKRRSYDSVDPFNDDTMPVSAEVSKADFFRVYGEAFERNSKWSNKQPVPKFGDENSSFSDVMYFYDFWYTFDSWREFSYLDKEDKEVGENRYQRRAIEKENKAQRMAEKKEETLRIRKVLDEAYRRDFRVKLYMQQQRREKEELRKLKKQRKSQNGSTVEGNCGVVVSISEIFSKERMSLQRNVEKFKSLNVPWDAVQSINNFLGVLSLDVEEINLQKAKRLNLLHDNGLYQEFRDQFFEEFEECGKFVRQKKQEWTVEDLQLLTKALNMFPNGYADRWKQITRYVNSKGKETNNFGVKSVMKMAKDLESFGDATEFFRKANSQQEFEKPQNGVAKVAVWSKEEQKVLEQALKTYSASTPERWDRIAACVTSKTKTECVERCKEILKKIKKPKK